MEKGAALYFECGDSLLEAFKEGGILKAYMADYSEDKEWEETWKMQGDEFLSDTEKLLPDLIQLIHHLDRYSYEVEVFLDGKLIGFVKDI